MEDNFLKLDRTTQKQVIETIIFASEQPISIEELTSYVESKIDFSDFKMSPFDFSNNEKLELESYILELINEINFELENTNRPYRIIKVANGYTFATHKLFGKILGYLPQFRNKRRFTKAMLETLAIIAYKQPITKPEIEEIRGTNSSEIVNTLLERNLIKIVGRKETLGRPYMYGTTIEFLKVFGLNDLSELPDIDEVKNLIEAKNKREELTLKIDFDGENT